MSSFRIDQCCSSDSGSTHWDQLRTERLEVAVARAVGAGRMPEDAKGHTGAQKATEKFMEQKGKLRSLSKSLSYQLLETRRVSLMSQLAQAAVGVAILDPSGHKSCPWSPRSSEAPAAGVTLPHNPPAFIQRKTRNVSSPCDHPKTQCTHVRKKVLAMAAVSGEEGEGRDLATRSHLGSTPARLGQNPPFWLRSQIKPVGTRYSLQKQFCKGETRVGELGA